MSMHPAIKAQEALNTLYGFATTLHTYSEYVEQLNPVAPQLLELENSVWKILAEYAESLETQGYTFSGDPEDISGCPYAIKTVPQENQ